MNQTLRQHPDLVRRVGPVVATVRVITLYTGGDAVIYRAFWKVPLGESVTDNPRVGNAAASVDPVSGYTGAVIFDPTGSPRIVSEHPETGAALDGQTLPYWPDLRDCVKRAAGLFHMIPVVGWDVAMCEDGPVIVEANTNPSLELPQFLSGEGAFAGEAGAALRKLGRASRHARSTARRKKRRRRIGLVLERVGLKRLSTRL